ncbi:metal-dependent hydrolase [Marinosulfonomonas sp. PRT-SC04]|nr:metal-dependent hydrolase [Marinosulfonomonas sp. PRT-SC04]
MQHHLRLGSYNMRKCVGLDRRRSPFRNLEVINSIGADIVALQEADRRLGKRPAALPREMVTSYSDFTPIDLDETGVSLGWHGNAILVRNGLEVSGIQRLSLPGLEPRGAVIADIGPLRFVAVHLGLIRRYRLFQMKAIIAALEVLPPKPTVIAGDFNEWSASRGMEPLKAHFTVHSPGLSFHAARPVAALDRFVISQDVHLKTAGVVQTPLAKRASDHLPVWADVMLG